MGKSVFKDLIREIKGSLGRFISIMAITAIGAAFFAGVTASSGDKVIKVKNGVVDSVTVNENPLPIEQIEW